MVKVNWLRTLIRGVCGFMRAALWPVAFLAAVLVLSSRISVSSKESIEWAKVVVDFLKVAVWPLMIYLVASILRSQLRDQLPEAMRRVSKASVGLTGVDLEFLREVSLDSLSELKPSVPSGPETDLRHTQSSIDVNLTETTKQMDPTTTGAPHAPQERIADASEDSSANQRSEPDGPPSIEGMISRDPNWPVGIRPLSNSKLKNEQYLQSAREFLSVFAKDEHSYNPGDNEYVRGLIQKDRINQHMRLQKEYALIDGTVRDAIFKLEGETGVGSPQQAVDAALRLDLLTPKEHLAFSTLYALVHVSRPIPSEAVEHAIALRRQLRGSIAARVDQIQASRNRLAHGESPLESAS